MVLILSEEKDFSSDIVCSWLNYYQCQYIRINNEKANDYEATIGFNNNNSDLVINLKNSNICFNFSSIGKTWFRRGYFNFLLEKQILSIEESVVNSINNRIDNESKTLTSFLYYLLKQKESINNPLVYDCNKLIALYEAQKLGFKIPPTIISCDGAEINVFFEKHDNIIVKNIQDLMFFGISNDVFPALSTMKVKKEEPTKEKYWYSLFQKEISKKYELRIFYFLGKTYTAAIFSQLDKDSSVDYRNVDVNGTHPNRIVPFNLPVTVKNRIKKLMKKLGLESGSIDIIVNNLDDYYCFYIALWKNDNTFISFHFKLFCSPDFDTFLCCIF